MGARVPERGEPRQTNPPISQPFESTNVFLRSPARSADADFATIQANVWPIHQPSEQTFVPSSPLSNRFRCCPRLHRIPFQLNAVPSHGAAQAHRIGRREPRQPAQDRQLRPQQVALGAGRQHPPRRLFGQAMVSSASRPVMAAATSAAARCARAAPACAPSAAPTPAHRPA